MTEQFAFQKFIGQNFKKGDKGRQIGWGKFKHNRCLSLAKTACLQPFAATCLLVGPQLGTNCINATKSESWAPSWRMIDKSLHRKQKPMVVYPGGPKVAIPEYVL
jgi:hypothetical protein